MDRIRDEIVAFIRARYPLVNIVSSEERRVEEKLRDIARQLNKRLSVWTITQGLSDGLAATAQENTADPLLALDSVLQASPAQANLFVFKDFHPFLDASQTVCIRKLRDAIHHLLGTNSSLFVLSPVLRIPLELDKEITVLDFPVPSKTELRELLADFEKEHQPRVTIKLDEPTREAVISGLLGLTWVEAENVLSRALINDRRLDASDLELIIGEKEQIVRKAGLLEFYPLREGLNEVGGLDRLKVWLRRKRAMFSDDATGRGLRTPRGVLLIGVPGCGKSLAAKAVAREWQMPLLRFDVGRVFGMYVGQSEENLRRAIRTAESVAPCVLWIDEIEKGFAGTGGGELDSGVSARVFGSFITWLQEKRTPVYVVATANDVSHLPPELLRKGRFDEIFFVDLPTLVERQEIFRVHLARHARHAALIDISRLAEAAAGYAGSDIEEAVEETMELGFSDGMREPTTEDALSVIGEMLPLSATMKEKIEALRNWARTRARRASSPMEVVQVLEEEEYGKRRLDL